MPGEKFRETLQREELLRTLDDVERSLDGPSSPRFASARDLVHLESALSSWIDAADLASGVNALAEDQAWAADTLTRFRTAQRESIDEIRRVIAEAEDADSPEELAHLNERAREAVANAVKLQSRKQRFVERVLDGEFGDGD